MADTPLGILRGNLDVLVLKALSWGPMHGFEITAFIEERANGNLELVESALYQSLYRLESRRLVKATWGVTEQRRRARYYHLTERGQAMLREESERWSRYAATVSAILSAQPPSHAAHT